MSSHSDTPRTAAPASTDAPPAFSIIIVTYNSSDWIDRCLASIARETRTPHEIIVVDNASPDNTADVLRALDFPGQIVLCDTNMGFAGAVNVGAAHASASTLILLNPDVEVLDGALDALYAFSRSHPGHGTYGGRTVGLDGQTDPSSCWGLPTLWSMFCFATGLSTIFRHSPVLDPESLGAWARDDVREVGMVTGCLLLIEAALWREIGGLDERYFMYGEDADLAYRLRRKGYTPVITPEATVIHAVGASSPSADKRVMVLRGKATLLRRRWRWPASHIGLLMLVIGTAVRGGLERLRGEPGSWAHAAGAAPQWVKGWPRH